MVLHRRMEEEWLGWALTSSITWLALGAVVRFACFGFLNHGQNAIAQHSYDILPRVPTKTKDA